MSRLTTSAVTAGTLAALSLCGLSNAALAAGQAPDKPGHLTHTHLTLKATKEKVTRDHSFKATVAARLRAKHAPLAGEPVSLQERQKGASWSNTGTTATTDADGSASFSFVQSDKKEQYRVVFAGDTAYRHSHSGTITITRLKSASDGSSSS